MIGRGGQDLPWRDGDAVLVTATAVVGLAAIVVGWYGASGTAVVEKQVAWLNLAVAGFAIAATGMALWLLRLRRAIGERRSLLIALEPVEAVWDDGSTTTFHDESRAESTTSLELVRVAGMRRIHHAGCPLVAGKQVEPVGAGDGQQCGVCSP